MCVTWPKSEERVDVVARLPVRHVHVNGLHAGAVAALAIQVRAQAHVLGDGVVVAVESVQELLVAHQYVALEEVLVVGVDASSDARVRVRPAAVADADHGADQIAQPIALLPQYVHGLDDLLLEYALVGEAREHDELEQ